ncbi:MAG: lipopolysaccharide heptosyltransferase I [Legionellales bacterium]|mgnify:CR=1 FL=1|nr:lipopolysaccharide heptosyltransferase I [Legionellales bacterium]|tara:strand:+ start:28550 stop:29575 length:1026 start_codon:yes stop_codon:yes gene_type:complete
MKVLIIKTSSMGDVIHTLPALTDAAKAIPDIEFDWVVEAPFKEIPAWHPRVKRVIPVALRRWRKMPLSLRGDAAWQQFRQEIKAEQYDIIIDAQGLIKSAMVTRMARGLRCGLDFKSAREGLASLAYHKKYTVEFKQHAVVRARQLFSQVLGYELPKTVADYGVDTDKLPQQTIGDNSLVFLHGTTWATKHWPESYWHELTKLATTADFNVLLPWGNDTERERARRIAAVSDKATVLPKMNLAEIAGVLANAKMAVAVDTGLGHLAAAMALPTISLYGPTDPVLTGTDGANQIHLAAQFSCAPCLQKSCTYKGPRDVEPACFMRLPPLAVWQRLREALACD